MTCLDALYAGDAFKHDDGGRFARCRRVAARDSETVVLAARDDGSWLLVYRVRAPLAAGMRGVDTIRLRLEDEMLESSVRLRLADSGASVFP